MPLPDKKAVIRLTGGHLLRGYLPARNFVQDGTLPLLLTDGRCEVVPAEQLQAIFFVRDFNVDDPLDPERLGRRQFLGRPRTEGLWLRLAFAELAPLEALAAFDLLALEDIAADGGLLFAPPDPRSNASRIFVPRHAIRELIVLGWIGSTLKRTAATKARRTELESQAGLFDDPSSS